MMAEKEHFFGAYFLVVGGCLRVSAAMHAMQQVLQHVSVCLDMILDRELKYSWHGMYSDIVMRTHLLSQ